MAGPRALLVTAFALYGRGPDAPAIPVAGLVRLLGRLDVDEQAVRAAVSRLKRRGLIRSVRENGSAGYQLTDSGRAVFDGGDERIFADPSVSGSGWILCVFSVPEDQRAKRHLLRRELTWLGFGQAAGGVWIAPSRMLVPTRAMLRRTGLSEFVSLFASEYLGETPTADAVASWWDLTALAERYREFIAEFGGQKDGDPLATWLRAVTRWRLMPYLDPGLDAGLLPEDWPGHEAWRLFRALDATLSATAADEAARLLNLGPPAGRGRPL